MQKPRSSAIHNPERLAALSESGLLDSTAEESFERITHLAAELLHTRHAGVALVTGDRQLFRGAVGLPSRWASRRETPLSHSLCKYVVRAGNPVVVENAHRYTWLRESPAVKEMQMVAYAGIPLHAADGHRVGTLCTWESSPRRWKEQEIRILRELAGVVDEEISLLRGHRGAPHLPGGDSRGAREAVEELLSTTAQFRTLVEQSMVGIAVVQDGRFRYANPGFAQIFGYTEAEVLALPSVLDVVEEEDRALVAENLRKRVEGEVDTLRYTFRGRRKDGQAVHVEVHGTRTRIDGRPAVVGILLDITERVQTEAALRWSEERMRRILDMAHDAFVAIDEDGVITDWNHQAESIFGWTRAEALGATLTETIIPERLRDAHQLGMTRFQSTGEGPLIGRRIEVPARRKDGTDFPVELTITPIQVGDSYIFTSFLHDITRRKEAEEALQRSEERFRLVARATNDVLWEWDVETGELTWSETATRVFRYAPDEMGTSLEWWYERIHPDDRERVISELHVLLSGTGEVWSNEYRFLRGDAAYATLLDRGYLVRNGRSGPVRMIGTMMDVTERRRAEEAQRFLARASGLLENSLDPETTFPGLARFIVPTLADYCAIDLVEEEQLRRVAAAHVTPAREVLLGQDDRVLLETCSERDPVVRAVRRLEPVLVTECGDAPLRWRARDPEHRRRMRELRPRSLMVVPLLAHQRVLGAITFATAESGRRYGPMDLLVAQDLGRRAALALDNARLYHQAQEAVRAREEILGVVSHDLRNPLHTIKLSTELLLDGAQERRSGNAQWLDVIHRATEQMERMILDLLDLSSIDAGGFTIAPEHQDVEELLRDVRELFRPLALERSIEIRCETGPELSTAWVDPHLILRVFSNLVGNALKFTPEGGALTLRAERWEEGVRFSVSDTGPGIPPDKLPHVFDRYWQARQGDRRGAGLGLSIAKGIVEAHGGRIWAESPPGEGATFHFTVPVAPR